MSVAVTKNVTGIPEVLLVFMVIFKSPARTGGVVSDPSGSSTLTTKLSEDVFPAASYAVQITWFVPIGNRWLCIHCCPVWVGPAYTPSNGLVL